MTDFADGDLGLPAEEFPPFPSEGIAISTGSADVSGSVSNASWLSGAGVPYTFWPEPNWEWSVFGGNPSILTIRAKLDAPLWRRIITRIFFGSKWTKL